MWTIRADDTDAERRRLAPAPVGGKDCAQSYRSEEPIAADRQVHDEVERDLAAVDWAATPLGPPASWPQSLHTTVRTMLGSRFAMWMAWGPELTFFCNDAYRRDTLGSKYPWALGRSAREVWAEIWPEIGPRIDKVIRSGDATWDEGLKLYLERSGYPEETYHTFSYSPLADHNGAVTGMLCVVSEDTDRVISGRRMATLRDLGAATGALLPVDEVCAAAADQLGRNRADFPFALLYVAGGEGKEAASRTARLAGTVGLEEGHPAAPPRLALDDPNGAWQLPSGDGMVVDLKGRFPELPAGDQPEEPTHAIVLPLAPQPGGQPHAWLVAALNSFRPFDETYRGFLELIARQISGGLATATAYESERRRAEQLAELDRAKTAFFTNISHELRTPLTLMLGPLSDALSADLPAAQREQIGLAHRSAERLLGLVNTLLDFSRLEAGRVSARPEPTDLARYTAELVSMFDSVARDADLTLRIEVPENAPVVAVDRDMWSKIVVNLVANAVKYTFAGGITVQLRLPPATAVTGTEPVVELVVADTGIGIEIEQQARLFERFHRVEGVRARSHEGSGIGLALVAELVSLHGGAVSLESAPGVGSTFTVRIPVNTAEADATERAPATPRPEAHLHVQEARRWVEEAGPATAQPSASHGSHILVVDDNADMRRYLTSLLAPDYRVSLAVDGADALVQARREVPDLVLTDVMMPNLDGFGLLAELRRSPHTAGVPVIMVSARAGEDGVAEGLEAGADDYLTKPFSARELLARIRANLELDRARRVREELEESRALLDQAQRLARVGSWEIDLASQRIRSSPQFARMLRLTPEQADMDLATALERLLHPEDRQRVADALSAGVAGEPISYEAVFRTGDGGEVLMEIVGEVFADVDGTPIKLRGSIQDIAERRRLSQQRAADVAAREVVAREHQIAEELQASLLPGLDFDPDHLEVATFYRAGVEGTQVGGDWYDVIELGAGRTALVIGDVMGRGVRAAAVMGQLRTAIRAYARLDLPPADVLELCDGAVRELGPEQIVTCVYAVFDPVDGTLSYANAGHLPPLLVAPDGSVERLSGSAAPLGSGPLTIEDRSVRMTPGATLALYTDGLVERRDRDIDAGVRLLATQIAASPAVLARAPAELVGALLPEGPDDDVALLLARIPVDGPVVPSVRFAVGDTLRTVASARHWVVNILRGWDLDLEQCEYAELLVGELVANALTHGAGPVELRLRHTRDALMLEVSDEGAFLPRRLRPGIDDEHGRGLMLVAAMAQRWGVRPTPTGKAVWCVLPLNRGTQL